MSTYKIHETSQAIAERRQALLIVWYAISSISAVILLLPLFVPKHLIIQTAPICLSKISNTTECSLCSMTRAFIEICRGNIQNALSYNKGSVWLFSVMAFNVGLCIYYSVYGYKKSNLIPDNKKYLTAEIG